MLQTFLYVPETSRAH